MLLVRIITHTQDNILARMSFLEYFVCLTQVALCAKRAASKLRRSGREKGGRKGVCGFVHRDTTGIGRIGGAQHRHAELREMAPAAQSNTSGGDIAVTKRLFIDCPVVKAGGPGGGTTNNGGLYYIPDVFVKEAKDSKSSLLNLGGRRISRLAIAPFSRHEREKDRKRKKRVYKIESLALQCS